MSIYIDHEGPQIFLNCLRCCRQAICDPAVLFNMQCPRVPPWEPIRERDQRAGQGHLKGHHRSLQGLHDDHPATGGWQDEWTQRTTDCSQIPSLSFLWEKSSRYQWTQGDLHKSLKFLVEKQTGWRKLHQVAQLGKVLSVDCQRKDHLIHICGEPPRWTHQKIPWNIEASGSLRTIFFGWDRGNAVGLCEWEARGHYSCNARHYLRACPIHASGQSPTVVPKIKNPQRQWFRWETRHILENVHHQHSQKYQVEAVPA